MLSPSTFNFDGSDLLHPPIIVGQDWNPLITLYDDQALTDPFDLTGYNGSWVVNGVATLTDVAGTLVLGGEFGTVAPFLPHTTTSLFRGGFSAHYYLQLTDPLGLVGFAMRGSMVWSAP